MVIIIVVKMISNNNNDRVPVDLVHPPAAQVVQPLRDLVAQAHDLEAVACEVEDESYYYYYS